MTSRFYFDLTNGLDSFRDDDGVDANDLDDATRQTQIVLDEMRDDGNASTLEDGWHLIIRDESGATLKTLPVTEAPSGTARESSRGRASSNDNEDIPEAMQS